jgi:hypothetical protein
MSVGQVLAVPQVAFIKCVDENNWSPRVDWRVQVQVLVVPKLVVESNDVLIVSLLTDSETDFRS